MDLADTRLVGMLSAYYKNLRHRRKYDYHSAHHRFLHGYMAIILFVGYLLLVLWNISRKKKEERINIPWLLIIGILVQFGWEAGLFLGGIRSTELGTAAQKLAPMIINSLLETNLGMPYIFAIFIAFSAKYTEKLTKRKTKLSFISRIVENNSEKVKSEEISEYLK